MTLGPRHGIRRPPTNSFLSRDIRSGTIVAQQLLQAVGVGGRRGRYYTFDDVPLGINQQMSFASFDLFYRIVSDDDPLGRRLDALCVDDA